jgi:hypothetical protein
MGIRYDVVYATKELSRVLSEPTKIGNDMLHRALLYVKRTSDAYLSYSSERMHAYKLPATRKKPSDTSDTYQTEYNVTDEVIQEDEKPVQQQYLHPGPPMHVVVLTDCDLAGQIETRQTTTSLMVMVQGTLVHWRASTERIIIPSTAAGEYVALSRGNTTAKYVNDVLKFYGNPPTSYYLYTDNQAAEHIATQPNMNEHSRSIDTRHHAIRQDYVDGHMRIGGVASHADNTSDILTKYLQPPLHEKHAQHQHITQEKRPPKTTLTNCVLRFGHSYDPSTNTTSCEFPPAFLALLPQRPTLTKRQKKRHRQQYWNAIHTLRQQHPHLHIMSKPHMTKQTPDYHNHCQPHHPRWPRNPPATVVLQRNAPKPSHV